MPSNKQKVLEFIASIPKGKVSTYGLVAKATGIRSPRAVGQMLHNNPDPKKYPCHRVVFKDGRVSTNYAFGGRSQQMARLKKEGILFISNKVDLKKHLL